MRLNSLGIVEVKSIAAAIEAANVMVRTSKVELIGKESAGEGYITLLIHGKLNEVESAVDAAVLSLQKRREFIIRNIIPCVHLETYKLILDRTNIGNIQYDAIGVIETKGLLGLISASDAMVKNTDIKILNKENLSGTLVALKIEGKIEHVKAALTIGTEVSRKLGQFLRTEIIQEVDDRIKFMLINSSENTIKNKDGNTNIEASFIENSIRSESININPNRKKSKMPKQLKADSEVISITTKNNGKTTHINEKKQPIIEKEYKENTLFDSYDETELQKETNINSKIDIENLNLEEINKRPIHLTETESSNINELEKLSVSKLRRLARDFENFPIKGRNISMANRNMLLESFKCLLS